MNDNEQISFDVGEQGIHFEDYSNSSIADGTYLFRVLQTKKESVEQTEKMGFHYNLKFQLLLETEDGPAGKVWDNLHMHMKFLWKYAQISRAIGHSAPGSEQVRIDFSKFVGSEGKVEVSHKTYTKKDGSEGNQAIYRYLPPDKPDTETENLGW